MIAAWVLALPSRWRSFSDRRQPDRPQPASSSCRHELLILDHEFKRVSFRLQSGDRA
jgi:hypothetical protein